MSEVQRNLSVSLRPNRFSDVIGYGRTVDRIKKQFESGRIPTAMKFVGMSRGGKTTLAKIVATSVNCTHAAFGEPCDECIQKVADRTFDVQEINAALLNKVEDARNLVKDLVWQPQDGLYRVLLLDECQQMTDSAQNVLLKELEREKDYNIFIFCTTDPTKLIVPLQKRCGSNQFVLDGLTEQEIKQLVWRVSKQVPVEGGWNVENLKHISALLWERCILAPGDIVSAVEALFNGATPEEAAVSSDFSGKVNVYRLIDAIENGDWSTAQAELTVAEPRDGAELVVRLSADLRKKMLNPSTPPARMARLQECVFKLLERETPVAGLMLTGLTASAYEMCQMAKPHVQSMQRAA